MCGLVLAPMAARSAEEPAPVRVFDAGELTLARYTVVQRLWTGSWRASLWIPSHSDAGSAIAGLTTEAARLGADAVINLHCLNDSGGWSPGYTCYGLAIKLKP
jgi:hypothetical protein